MNLKLSLLFLFSVSCSIESSINGTHNPQLLNNTDTILYHGEHRFASLGGTQISNQTNEQINRRISRYDAYIAGLFELKVKNCVKEASKLYILFSQNKILCDEAPDLPNPIQGDLIEYSKKYMLNLLHLPQIEDIAKMNLLPKDQLNQTFINLLTQAGFDPRNASESGKTFIRSKLHDIPGGVTVFRVVLDYYWSSSLFKVPFVNRAFTSLANTLSLQEYFELESLLKWLHDEYHILTKDQWTELLDIIERHYTHSKFSITYWKAWAKKRPLLG